MLKFVILAVVATLCVSQDLGDRDYIACDDCRIPDGEFPKEGYGLMHIKLNTLVRQIAITGRWFASI